MSRIETGRREVLWYSSILKAEERANISLPHEVEGYLVITVSALLKTDFPELFSISLLRHTQSGNREKLRSLANRALIYSGLFPGRTRRLGLARDYFTNISRAAFYELFMLFDGRHDIQTAAMYRDLCVATPDMVSVLHHLRRSE